MAARTPPSRLGNEKIDGIEGRHHGRRVQRRQRIGGLLNSYYCAA
jgi:hypothetical protein